jgi:hypothetical protein
MEVLLAFCTSCKSSFKDILSIACSQLLALLCRLRMDLLLHPWRSWPLLYHLQEEVSTTNIVPLGSLLTK